MCNKINADLIYLISSYLTPVESNGYLIERVQNILAATLLKEKAEIAPHKIAHDLRASKITAQDPLAYKIAYFAYSAGKRNFCELDRLLKDSEITEFDIANKIYFFCEPLFLALSRAVEMACINDHPGIVQFLLNSQPYQKLARTKQPHVHRGYSDSLLINSFRMEENRRKIVASFRVAAAKEIHLKAMLLCCELGKETCLSVLCQVGSKASFGKENLDLALSTAFLHKREGCIKILMDHRDDSCEF